MATIIRSKGGTAERTVEVDEIKVPDLWHIVRDLGGDDRDKVLECWVLCNDLLQHLKES